MREGLTWNNVKRKIITPYTDAYSRFWRTVAIIYLINTLQQTTDTLRDTRETLTVHVHARNIQQFKYTIPVHCDATAWPALRDISKDIAILYYIFDYIEQSNQSPLRTSNCIQVERFNRFRHLLFAIHNIYICSIY